MSEFNYSKLKGKTISEVIEITKEISKDKNNINIALKIYHECINKFKLVPNCEESQNRGKVRNLIWDLIKDQYPNFKSQSGQDKFVFDFFFKDKKKGIFFDIGAYDGITGSNTFFFENQLKWDGFCIEPNMNVFHELKKNRKSKLCNLAISNENKLKEFININSGYTQMSGLKETMKAKQKIFEKSKYQIRKILTKNIQDFFKEYEINKINFLSIDTEGHEEKILGQIDYSKIEIDVICVENNQMEQNINIALSENFIFVDYVGMDEIWVNKNYK